MGKAVGLVGSITNKVGNFVFSTWKGIQVVKAYQPNVTNPRSTGQTAQRTKFDFAVQYARAMIATDELKQVWNYLCPVQLSGYNNFVRNQLLNAVYSSDNRLAANRLAISPPLGSLCPFRITGNSVTEGSSGDYDFAATLGISHCGTDPNGAMLVFVYNSHFLDEDDTPLFPDAKICIEYYPDMDFTTPQEVGGSFPVGAPYNPMASTGHSPDLSGCLYIMPTYADESGTIVNVGPATIVGNDPI